MNNAERKVILVSSLISNRTEGPRVDITVGEIRVQLSSFEASDLALNILQAAAAAESDAFIFNFITEKVGQTKNAGAAVVGDFRDYRDALEKEWLKDK